MSKAMIKSLERKPLNPWTLGPSSTTKLEKNHKFKCRLFPRSSYLKPKSIFAIYIFFAQCEST